MITLQITNDFKKPKKAPSILLIKPRASVLMIFSNMYPNIFTKTQLIKKSIKNEMKGVYCSYEGKNFSKKTCIFGVNSIAKYPPKKKEKNELASFIIPFFNPLKVEYKKNTKTKKSI